ncbi:PAS domain S-box-containing protein [Fluviicoccus keumensis]|uniref:histidine kinase n=1 Tax=Fluviicoccus keumensis TaxID=1435465 RepID=A0A4Q7ZAP5_9GAMM|nr:ATP-binding protein [Fluviicoccus keumensis]RZU47672.1 PAS domain S-box-containing protein [Fluviicoccus keumensis]
MDKAETYYEIDRLEALHALQILDTPPEERFDRLARIARDSLRMPIVLIALIDAERYQAKACLGFDAREGPREATFCDLVIQDNAELVVRDAAGDPAFAALPAVVHEGIRFYAGVPLHAGDRGLPVGTLCVMDTVPRTLTPSEMSLLHELAAVVEQQMELQHALDAVRELNEQRVRLYAIFESVAEGIMIIDDRGIIENFNPALLEMFGYNAVELPGQSAEVLIPGFLSEHSVLEQPGDRLKDNHHEGRRRSGEVFPLEISASRMSIDNRSRFTVVLNDVSERRQMERMKNEFISTVSHELRTPLTSIRGALGLVLGKASDGLTPKARQLLETASRNSERLTLLINDILDLERIESGRMEFVFAPMDLVQAARQAITANEGYADRHNVRLRLETAPESAPVMGDEHRLAQVFANLLSNAVKYSPTGQTVSVDITRQGGQWRVSVSDLGKGIPEAFRNRIFQRFAQADASDTREKGGTGLGLSITKAIVERHDGHIDYLSSSSGTTFFFTLPVRPGEEQTRQGGDVRYRLLICEHSPEAAVTLSGLLRQDGFANDIAFTTAKARRMLAIQHYDVIILNLLLKDGDGLSLLRELRQQPDLAGIPVILIRNGGNTEELESLNVTQWLDKPVDPEHLSAALRQALHAGGRPRILHVEDDPDVVQITRELVEDTADYTMATTLAEARQCLAGGHYDLVMLDLSLPDGNGLDLLEGLDPLSRVLVFSGRETSRDLGDRIGEALTKSRTTNEHLLSTIKTLLKP